MTEYRARVASSPRHVLAEGPVWNAASGTVIWVDIVRGTVFEGVLGDGRIEVLREWQFDGMVGAAAPGPDGTLLVAAQDRLVVVASDGTRRDGPLIVEPGDPSRTNDGACDPAGRFLIGTLAFDELGGHDLLFQIEDDGSRRTLDSDLAISNGLAWSPDGRTLYNADTIPAIIWSRDYDVATGATGPRREQFRITDNPDGICVDVRGYLWAAVWGTGQARCFDLDGAVVDVVDVGVPHVSSVCFVGPELDRLLITTASRDLDDAGLAQYPDAGRLFLADVGVAGTPTFPWSGSWGAGSGTPVAASTP
jgi:sugar lactone lactonase YvrE